MPVDANLAIPVRAPEIPDPLEQYSRALSLRNLAGQGQMQQEQLRATQMANQERERQQREQAALEALYHETNGDIPKMIELAPARHLSPMTMGKLKDADVADKTARSKLTVDQLAASRAQKEALGDKIGRAHV